MVTRAASIITRWWVVSKIFKPSFVYHTTELALLHLRHYWAQHNLIIALLDWAYPIMGCMTCTSSWWSISLINASMVHDALFEGIIWWHVSFLNLQTISPKIVHHALLKTQCDDLQLLTYQPFNPHRQDHNILTVWLDELVHIPFHFISLWITHHALS